MTNSLKLRISVIVLAVLMALEVFAPVLTSFADEEDDYIAEENDYIAEESYSESSGTAADSGDTWNGSDDDYDESGSESDADIDDETDDDEKDEDAEASEAADNVSEAELPELLLHPEKLDEMLRAEFRKADPEGKTFSDEDIAELANMLRGYFTGTAKLLDVYMKPGVKDSEKEKALEEYKNLFDTDIPGLGNSGLQAAFAESGLPETLNKIKERETQFLEGIYDYTADGMPAKEYAQNFRRDLDLIFPGLGYGDYADRLVGVLYGTEKACKKLMISFMISMADYVQPTADKVVGVLNGTAMSDRELMMSSMIAEEREGRINEFKKELNTLYPGYGDSEQAAKFAAETVYEMVEQAEEIRKPILDKVILCGKYGNEDERDNAIDELKEKMDDMFPGLGESEYSDNEEARIKQLFSEVEALVKGSAPDFFSWMTNTKFINEKIEKITKIYPGFQNSSIIEEVKLFETLNSGPVYDANKRAMEILRSYCGRHPLGTRRHKKGLDYFDRLSRNGKGATVVHAYKTVRDSYIRDFGVDEVYFEESDKKAKKIQEFHNKYFLSGYKAGRLSRKKLNLF